MVVLARQWAQQGAIYQAIFAYNGMLIRYAGTPVGEAAAEELLEMVPVLEQQGKFYTILDLLRKIEYAG